MSDASFMQVSQSFISYICRLQVEISLTKWYTTPGRVHVAQLLQRSLRAILPFPVARLRSRCKVF